MIDAHEALKRLKEGNHRFVTGQSDHDAGARAARRDDILDAQSPFAVVLGCSDSRVPVEFVFDQGLGDLFVIRVAGNIVARSQIGSIEFAADAFGTRLVVVMGHTRCGAVRATLSELQRPTANQSPNLRSIVDRIRPAVQDLVESDLRHDPDELERTAVRANVRVAVNQLRNGSPLLESLGQEDGLLIVGAEYALESGTVEFFEGAE